MPHQTSRYIIELSFKKKKHTMVLAQKQKCRSMDYIIEKMQGFQQPCRKTRTRHRERLAEREIISKMFEKAAGKQDILCLLKLHRIYINACARVCIHFNEAVPLGVTL